MELMPVGYPVDQAATVAVRTVRDTLRVMKTTIGVTFCCFSRQDHAAYTAPQGSTDGR